MACLGGRVELNLLRIASGAAAGMAGTLEPAVQDGLLMAEPGTHEAVRFRHDRIREAILGRLEPERRRGLQFAMARRLAAVPELHEAAAQQYLPVADAVGDPAERRLAAGLIRRAARQAILTGDYRSADKLLTGALALTGPDETATLVELRTSRHAALFSMGRLDEADQDYRVIDALTRTVLDRPEATALQVRSLTNRGRFAEAIGLGTDSLRECGIPVPARDRMPAEIDHLFDHMYRWLDHTDAARDIASPEITDRALVTAGQLLDAMMAAAFFMDDLATYGWVGLRALRIWTEHGTARTLIGTAANAAFNAVVQRGDYDAAYRVARRVLALGESRGYEPGTSHARLVLSLLQAWFEPAEASVQTSRQARETLLAGGDLANAGYTYHQTAVGLLDCAPTLDECLAQVDAALAFARRTGAELPNQWLTSYQWLADVLRRDGPAVTAPADSYESNPLILIHVYLARAIAAAIFGDPLGLAKHSAAALPLLPVVAGYSVSAMAHPLRGLSLAWLARDTDGDGRAGLLAELDDVLRWLAARAADAPDNFLHLLRLVEAERAWAEDDFRTAAVAFDAARGEAASRQRPWHRALIAERAGRFYLAHGLEHIGYGLLTRARQEYLDWGATAKVRQLTWAYPALQPGTGTDGEQSSGALRDRNPVTTGDVDLLGILSASQALSSATSVEQLHARVAEVLGRMTGATGVNLLLWNEDRQDWLLAPGSDGEHAVPMSVLRYVRRTREPLTVGDVTTDDRFTRDTYFKNADCCSLLAMPILGQGALQAVLLLENRLIRGAFTVARLDAVELIAGQLAVSLRNAQLYTGYRRIGDEQAALRRVATLVARAARPEAVFTAVAEETGRLLAADFAILVRYDPQDTLEVVGTWVRTGDPPATPVGGRLPLGGRNVTSLVYQTGRAARIDYDDVSGTIGAVASRDWGLRSSVAVPVNIESQLWGSLVVAFGHEELLPGDTEGRLAHFCELVGTAIANAEATAEVAASRARIVAAADDARRRIERDLHDGAQQRLVSLALQLRQARAAVPPGLDDLSAQLDRAVTAARGAVDEVSEIARGVHPAILTRGGLRPAVRALARRSPDPVQIDACTDQRLPEHVEVTAYYVVAEALTNAAKHARASAISVRAEITGEVLSVTVRDDGVGDAIVSRGTGLAGLKDRVEALGGIMLVDSPRAGGTVLHAELPLTPRP